MKQCNWRGISIQEREVHCPARWQGHDQWLNHGNEAWNVWGINILGALCWCPHILTFWPIQKPDSNEAWIIQFMVLLARAKHRAERGWQGICRGNGEKSVQTVKMEKKVYGKIFLTFTCYCQWTPKLHKKHRLKKCFLFPIYTNLFVVTTLQF